VYFTIIKNTVFNFQACFPPLMMSTCVKWAKEQVDTFNVTLARQLSSAELGGSVWIQCMNQAKEHATMLSEVGLDFKDLVGQMSNTTASKASQQGLGLSQ
jgi:exocyst complex component 8